MNVTSQSYTEISISNGKKTKIIEYLSRIGDIEREAIQGLNLLSQLFHQGFDSHHHSLKKRKYKSFSTTHFSFGNPFNSFYSESSSKSRKRSSFDFDNDDNVDIDDDDDETCFRFESKRKIKKMSKKPFKHNSKECDSMVQPNSTFIEPSTDEWFDMIHNALQDHYGQEATITELVIWLGENIDFCKFTPVDIWKRKLTNLLGHHPRRFIRRDRNKNDPKESSRPGTGGFWGLSQGYLNKAIYNLNHNSSHGSVSSDSNSSIDNDSDSCDSDESQRKSFLNDHSLRPTLATADIIQQVLMGQRDKKGSCNEIFQWIIEKFPWFKTQPTKRWHHTVRHALSSYKDLFLHFSPKDSTFKPPRGGFYGLKQFYDRDGKFNEC